MILSGRFALRPFVLDTLPQKMAVETEEQPSFPPFVLLGHCTEIGIIVRAAPIAALDFPQAVDPDVAVAAAGVALDAVAHWDIKLVNGVIL